MARTIALDYNVRVSGRSDREKQKKRRGERVRERGGRRKRGRERRTDDRLSARNGKPFAAL